MDKKKIIMLVIIMVICIAIAVVALYFINNNKNNTPVVTDYKEAYNSLSEEEKQSVKNQYNELSGQIIDEETIKNVEIPEEIEEVLMPPALTGPIEDFVNSRN